MTIAVRTMISKDKHVPTDWGRIYLKYAWWTPLALGAGTYALAGWAGVASFALGVVAVLLGVATLSRLL